MARLGLVGRIMLIVTAALVAIQLAALAASYGERDGWFGTGRGVPVVGSVVALARLLDPLTPAERTLALAAAEAGGLTAAILDAPPVDADEAYELRRVRGLLERGLAAEGLGGRLARVDLVPDDEDDPIARGPLRRLIGRHVRVVVGLADGRYLAVGFADRLTLRLFGLPLGFFAGLLGLGVAALAVAAVAREMRPLSRLARRVETIGTTTEPLPLERTGAREVRALIEAINRMQARIAGLVDGRTLMLGAISHDLRTYLTRLRLRGEMMPQGTLRDGVMRDVEAMRDLVEDTLLFAKASLEPDRSPTDAAAVAAEIVEARRAAGAAAALDAPDGPVPVPLGRPALTRVLDNLVDNALAYGGEASVRIIRAADGAALLTVADRGPGIPAAERERVFEPFFRLEGSRSREHGGTGLGLTIVRQLVAAAGGGVTLDERPGGGLLAAVRFPAGGDEGLSRG